MPVIDIDDVFRGLAREGTIEVARMSIIGPLEEWVSVIIVDSED